MFKNSLFKNILSTIARKEKSCQKIACPEIFCLKKHVQKYLV